MAAPSNKQSFGNLAGQLAKYRVGEHKGVAAKLSEMARAVNRNSAVLDPPGQIDRLVIPQVRMFKVDIDQTLAQGWDYISARTWDGVREGIDLPVILKPWFLRGVYWNAIGTAGQDPARNDITYTQTANQQRTAHKDGEDDEIQRIIPSYTTGDVIFAIRGVYGGFDVENVSGARDPEEAKWMDLNVDGRMWAKV